MDDFQLKIKAFINKYYFTFMKIAIVASLAFMIYVVIFDGADTNWQKKICPGFKGIVLYKEIMHKRTDWVYFVNLNNYKDTVRLSNPSLELLENTKIGDTVYKIPQRNECIIIKLGDSIKVKYSGYQFGPPYFRKCN